MCNNVPGLGAGKCDSGKVPTVNCSDGLDQCMSLKGKMMFPGFTQSIELKNCSNNVLCDSASDYNGTNRNEFSRPLLLSFVAQNSKKSRQQSSLVLQSF